MLGTSITNELLLRKIFKKKKVSRDVDIYRCVGGVNTCLCIEKS